MACSCIKANDKPFSIGGHQCGKNESGMSLKNKSSIYQEHISRIVVDITKKDNETLGLTVSGGADRGETPVIANIRPGSIAERSDIFLIGDHIISINGISTASLCHQEIVSLVKTSKPTITLVIDYELPERESHTDIRIKQTSISLPRREEDESYGFVVRGGYCKDPNKIRPLTVMHIRPGSLAERDGRIKPGDRIVSIKSCKVDHLTPENVVGLFREHKDSLSITIEYSVASVDMSAVSGRPIIVEIQKQVNERLGVSIATYHDNGTNSQIFYIENIESGSVADRCGVLQIGQIITAIQDLRTDKMAIQDAIEALKSGQRERIKLRIIPNLHFDQLKWSQSDSQMNNSNVITTSAPSITSPTDLSLMKLVNSKDLLSLTDDTNINTSNTDSLVGSDPLDLQCNCSELYGGGGNNSNQVHIRNPNTSAVQDDSTSSTGGGGGGGPISTVIGGGGTMASGSLPYTRRPKSVLGLEHEMYMVGGGLDSGDYSEDFMTTIPGHTMPGGHMNHQMSMTGGANATGNKRDNNLSKSATSLFTNSKSILNHNLLSKSQGSGPQTNILTNQMISNNNKNNQSSLAKCQATSNQTNKHQIVDRSLLEDLQVTLTYSNPPLHTSPSSSSHPFGISLISDPANQQIRLGRLLPGQPASQSGVLVEGDLLKSINGMMTHNFSCHEVIEQLRSLVSVGTVTLMTQYEVRCSDDPQLMLEGTVFEICLKKQGGSLGINLQALVTRTPGEPLIISKVLPGSAAYRSGCITPGDLLLALDNTPIDQCTLSEAVHLLQSSGDSLTLRIRKGPGVVVMKSTNSSNPSSLNQLSSAVNATRNFANSTNALSNSEFGIFALDLHRDTPTQPWGIVISGTDDTLDQPILIDSVNQNSAAAGVSRLAAGDQLLSINGQTLRGCTLTEAMKLLHRYPDQVRLTVLRRHHENSLGQGVSHAKPLNNEDYPINTKSLGRAEIRRHTKLNDNQRNLGSMTLPAFRSNENEIAIATTMTTESDSSDSHNTSASLFSKNKAQQQQKKQQANNQYPMSNKQVTSLSTTSYQHQQSASNESTSSNASSVTKDTGSGLILSNSNQATNASGSGAVRLIRNSSTGNSSGNSNILCRELSIAEEDNAVVHEVTRPASSNTMILEGSEVDSSQTDILESIQCPGCREAIANEWRSKEKINESLGGGLNTRSSGYSTERRTNRVHGGAIPMSVNFPEKPRNKSDSIKSIDDSKFDLSSITTYGTKRAVSEKDIYASQKSAQKYALVKLKRNSPTESFGIGVSEGLSPKGTFISAIKPNSPASNCVDLQLYDEIIEVNGLSTENMRCSDVVTLISQSDNDLQLLIRKYRGNAHNNKTNHSSHHHSNHHHHHHTPSSIFKNTNNTNNNYSKRSSSLKRITSSTNSSNNNNSNNNTINIHDLHQYQKLASLSTTSMHRHQNRYQPSSPSSSSVTTNQNRSISSSIANKNSNNKNNSLTSSSFKT